MKLIAGLGNPGSRYEGTRHNVGFEIVDRLARRQGVVLESAPGEALLARLRSLGAGALVVKPLTFMNLSGHAVAELVRYYRVALPDLLVVTDDVNLPLGRLRARPRGSHGGHNGLKSVAEQLGSEDFARLRIGVGRGDDRRDLADHVLARFEAGERDAIENALERAVDAVEAFVVGGIEEVMNVYNRPEDRAAVD
jgi:PTH1 family peptidyl-tRNA hydrolase